MVEIYIAQWESFLKMRNYIREMKRIHLPVRLVDKRDIHVFLITTEGKHVVYKSPTFNESIVRKWTEQRYPGSQIIRFRRRGEYGYEETLKNEW